MNNKVLFYQNIKKTMILVKYGNVTYQMMLFFEEANYVYYTSGRMTSRLRRVIVSPKEKGTRALLAHEMERKGNAADTYKQLKEYLQPV